MKLDVQLARECAEYEERIAELEQREQHWREYAALLGKECRDLTVQMSLRGYRCPDEKVKRSRELRTLLGLPENTQ